MRTNGAPSEATGIGPWEGTEARGEARLLSMSVQNASRWSGTILGQGELAWNVQAHTLAHQSEPDEKIRLWSDAPCIRNLTHGIRRVARVNKEGRGARFWMILRDMSH